MHSVHQPSHSFLIISTQSSSSSILPWMYKCNDNAMHCIVNCSRYGFELKFIQNAKVGVAFEILRKLVCAKIAKKTWADNLYM